MTVPPDGATAGDHRAAPPSRPVVCFCDCVDSEESVETDTPLNGEDEEEDEKDEDEEEPLSLPLKDDLDENVELVTPSFCRFRVCCAVTAPSSAAEALR